MRSSPRNPAWPSFMWNTSGAGPPLSSRQGPHRAHAADAEQQLLQQAVLAAAAVEPVGDRRSSSLFAGMSVSSSSSGMRPTDAFHTRACRLGRGAARA